MEKKTCAVFEQRYIDNTPALPVRDTCCLCKCVLFEEITRTVTHPGEYWCSVCQHRFRAPLMEERQAHLACALCYHSCGLCCGENSPKAMSVTVTCGACRAKTGFHVGQDHRIGKSWDWLEMINLEPDQSVNGNGKCRKCGHRVNLFRLFVKKMYRKFRVALHPLDGWTLTEIDPPSIGSEEHCGTCFFT